ncbi:hypothetical protein R1flu_022966 [Riccia fluitans]|uniref:Uncharacterized protein n=1 Tax=Riccia fluitans TaxID=41844 RepID=A0ABD1XQN8_9MARC
MWEGRLVEFRTRLGHGSADYSANEEEGSTRGIVRTGAKLTTGWSLVGRATYTGSIEVTSRLDSLDLRLLSRCCVWAVGGQKAIRNGLLSWRRTRKDATRLDSALAALLPDPAVRGSLLIKLTNVDKDRAETRYLTGRQDFLVSWGFVMISHRGPLAPSAVHNSVWGGGSAGFLG